MSVAARHGIRDLPHTAISLPPSVRPSSPRTDSHGLVARARLACRPAPPSLVHARPASYKASSIGLLHAITDPCCRHGTEAARRKGIEVRSDRHLHNQRKRGTNHRFEEKNPRFQSQILDSNHKSSIQIQIQAQIKVATQIEEQPRCREHQQLLELDGLAHAAAPRRTSCSACLR